MQKGDTSERQLNGWFALAVVGTLTVVLALRLIALDGMPGEIYGDIVIIYDYVAQILKGQWPINFVLSAGPLYQYAIVPVIWLSGLNYLGLKLASVAVSLGVVGLTYALADELEHRWLGLLSAFVAGVSSWLLIFSRLGNSQILVPLLTAGAALYALRAARTGRQSDLVACALVSALGLYTYPQNFILPVVSLITLALLFWLGPGMRPKSLLLFAGLSLLFALPFVVLVLRDPANFFSGYIGEKLPTHELGAIVLGNIWRGLLALHVRGDVNFRSNPTLLPQLDVLSGSFFFLGVIYWLLPARRRLSPALFVPLLLLQVPSLLVRYPIQVPSASRTLGIVPMAYILVASGLWWLLVTLHSIRRAQVLALVVTLATIMGLNSYRYFGPYIAGLPAHNTPFGRVIAEYIDSLPPQTHVYVRGCCWGMWEQPNPKGILYAITVPHMVTIVNPPDMTCDQVLRAPRPSVVIWNPDDVTFGQQLAQCTGAKLDSVRTNAFGEKIFQSASLP